MANPNIPASAAQSAPSEGTAKQQQSAYLLPKFHALYSRTLSTTLAKCSYSAFAACFPTPAAKKPDTLKTVWKQIVDKMDSKALAEFEAICQERELDKRFAELEIVLANAKKSMERDTGKQNGNDTNVALHSLPPSDLLLATLAPRLVPIASDIQQKISQQQKTNDTLVKQLLEKRAEIEHSMKILEDTVTDIQSANEVLYASSKDMEDTEGD